MATAITVRNLIDGAKLRDDIAVNPVDLSNEMMEQAQLRAHYGELKAQAQRQVDDLKLLLEASEAKIYRQLRDKYTEEAAAEAIADPKGKVTTKITEDLLKRDVAGDPRVIKIKRAINAAKQIADTAKSAYEAFGDRNDMLIQLGARDRTEMAGELRIKALDAATGAAGDRAMAALKRVRGEF